MSKAVKTQKASVETAEKTWKAFTLYTTCASIIVICILGLLRLFLV